jgi:hypothetical protein
MSYLLLFHSNNCFVNAPQCYAIRTLPVLFLIQNVQQVPGLNQQGENIPPGGGGEGVKRSGPEIGHSLQSSAEIKNVWSYKMAWTGTTVLSIPSGRLLATFRRNMLLQSTV